MTYSKAVSKAASEWKEALGSDHVLSEAEDKAAYRRSLIPVERDIPAVIRPGTREEVVAAIEIADRHGIPLHPISTGKNWGYGAAQPATDGQVILDLGRLNRVVEVDETEGYAVVEPGVTFGQLHDHLQEHDLDLIVDPVGGGPNTSVMANALERGRGAGPYPDHYAAICSMEVALADGTLLKTGFGHYEQARAKHLFKYGIGPHLNGLFSQSNLGVVLEMGLWLAPRPEYVELFFFKLEEEEAIGDAVGSLRRLNMQNALPGQVKLLSRNRLLTVAASFPDEFLGRELPERRLEALAEEHDLAAWNGVGTLYGARAVVKGARQSVKRALKSEVDTLQFVSRKKLRLLKQYESVLSWPFKTFLNMDLQKLSALLREAFELYTGTPKETDLSSPYWRTGEDPPARNIDPTTGNCGLFWIAPVVPLEREAMLDVLKQARQVFARYPLEFCPTVNVSDGRSAIWTIPIFYNRADAAESEKAQQCYDELMARLIEHGYIPYRGSIQSMEKIVDDGDAYWQTVRRIKESLDPNGILSPGKYDGTLPADEEPTDEEPTDEEPSADGRP